jgi:hypothetical protein
LELLTISRRKEIFFPTCSSSFHTLALLRPIWISHVLQRDSLNLVLKEILHLALLNVIKKKYWTGLFLTKKKYLSHSSGILWTIHGSFFLLKSEQWQWIDSATKKFLLLIVPENISSFLMGNSIYSQTVLPPHKVRTIDGAAVYNLYIIHNWRQKIFF